MGDIGDTYASLGEFKDYVGQLARDTNDATLTDALQSATQEIEEICNRQFNKTDIASARVYEPETFRLTKVDDFWTTDDLVVETDSGGTGEFAQLWANTDFELLPANGIVSGQPGWPFKNIRSCGGLWFPKYDTQPFRRRNVVRVTAKWGWNAVPAPVKQACLIMAAETWQLKNAPLGVAGVNQFGIMRVRQNTMAASKLQRYIRNPVLLG